MVHGGGGEVLSSGYIFEAAGVLGKSVGEGVDVRRKGKAVGDQDYKNFNGRAGGDGQRTK